MRIIFLGCSMLVLLGICYIGAQIVTPGGFQFGGSAAKSTYLCFALCTMLGIILSASLAALRELPQDRRVHLGAFINALLRPRTFISIVVGPVVLFAFLSALGNQEVSTLTYIAALQNGFFWDKVIKVT